MNAATLTRLQVIVLGAGFSSRLGCPKALVRVRSLTLLRRTLLLAARVSPAQIIVVLPPRAARYRIEARGLKVAFSPNPHRAAGLSSSVRRGIARARYSAAVLLLPVDLVALQHRDMERLVSRWRSTRRSVIARRIGPQGGACLAGIPLILPRWLYARARAVSGDIGLRELVNGLPASQRTLVELPSAEMDVDTAQDLRAARDRLRRSRLSP
ncbi:MAG TPA: NTP transferase domain-containing protein [Steroidobacteraceae bacterium]|nr:NTP transferase domain-containing protein [Steroidobacteraceae bacterium]